jgi:hypothetical protein
VALVLAVAAFAFVSTRPPVRAEEEYPPPAKTKLRWLIGDLQEIQKQERNKIQEIQHLLAEERYSIASEEEATKETLDPKKKQYAEMEKQVSALGIPLRDDKKDLPIQPPSKDK